MSKKKSFEGGENYFGEKKKVEIDKSFGKNYEEDKIEIIDFDSDG